MRLFLSISLSLLKSLSLLIIKTTRAIFDPVTFASIRLISSHFRYLGKRDFLDHGSHIDPIDGVVLIDPEYLKDRKVHAHVLAAFRYGRGDLDVLGLTFRKDLFLATYQGTLRIMRGRHQ